MKQEEFFMFVQQKLLIILLLYSSPLCSYLETVCVAKIAKDSYLKNYVEKLIDIKFVNFSSFDKIIVIKNISWRTFFTHMKKFAIYCSKILHLTNFVKYILNKLRFYS